jgi:inhibitor of cysteine peptidase
VERRVTLELEGNPTTGYSWTYIMEGEVLREVLAEYRPAPAEEGMTGRGGVFVFVFESLKPGRAELIFSYRRPWEENTEPAETRYFVFTVDEAGRIIRSGS